MRVNNTLKELINSRVYQNSSGKVFDSPVEVLSQSIQLLDSYVDDDKYRIKTHVGSVNRNVDNTPNIAYDKVIVEFQLNTFQSTEDYSNMCIVYDLSGKTPVYKIGVGKTIRTCLNMCIWADTDLYTHQDYRKVNDKLSQYLNTLSDIEDSYIKFKDTFENKILDEQQIYKVLGQVIYKTNNATLRQAVTSAADELQNSKSNYFVESDKTTLWNVYNSITQQFSNKFEKGYIDVPSHTLELSKILYN